MDLHQSAALKRLFFQEFQPIGLPRFLSDFGVEQVRPQSISDLGPAGCVSFCAKLSYPELAEEKGVGVPSLAAAVRV